MELYNNKKTLAVGTRKKVVSHDEHCQPQREISISGPKFPLLHEGDITVCRVSHQRSLLSKILGSRILRRWETHRIVLSEVQIYSRTVRMLGFYILSFASQYCDIISSHELKLRRTLNARKQS